MSAKLSINIITTGGTIEKTYDEVQGTLQNRKSFLRDELLEKLRLPHNELMFHELFAKDSLDMTDEDREAISQKVAELEKDGHPILIIHGTDTMVDSGLYLQNQLKNPGVPVIFTGAMKPIEFDDSDATQNVTEALYACRLARTGIYISFHGQLHSITKVRKDKTLRTFVKK